MVSKVKRLLIGRPMKSNELDHEKLSKVKALAVLSSDALSSVAYGTEQILIVLVAAGFTAIWYSLPIALAVLGLLAILILSYRQTIFAYPQGGGAYIVAKTNLGVHTGLLAGGSLLVDYILTVAVSASAGTDAITSAFPGLHNHSVLIAVTVILLLTIVNLRGVTESASFIAIPVYLFVVSIFVLIIAGVFKYATGGAHAQVPEIGSAVSNVSMFLLLKAFSSGCSALTGVEAVSNAIPNFKAPAEKNAAKTLMLMGLILGAMFTGITLLAYWYGIMPDESDGCVADYRVYLWPRRFVLLHPRYHCSNLVPGGEYSVFGLPAAGFHVRQGQIFTPCLHGARRPAGILQRHYFPRRNVGCACSCFSRKYRRVDSIIRRWGIHSVYPFTAWHDGPVVQN